MEWKTVKLQDVCIRITDGSHFSPQAQTEGYPMFSVKDMLEYGFDYSNCKRISKADFDGMVQNDCVPQKGDVLVAKDGSFLKSIFLCKETKEEAILSSIAIFRPDDKKILPAFLCYLLKSPSVYNYIASNCVSGSALPRIVLKDFKQVDLSIPDIETQRRIAAILSSLDDKIENNNRINRNLEAQAQALFKSWFVDFEPWGGTMPEDWKFGSISAFPHILETGRRPKGGAVESGVPSIGAEHIKGMGTYDYSKTKYITEEYARSMKTGKIKGYELLIYKDGGKPGYFIPNFTIYGEGYPFDECYINEHVLKLDFPNKAYNIFCYFYFQEPEIMTYLNAQGGKAAIPGINKSDIENISILSPENEAVKQFGDIAMPYFTTILRNLKENQRLAALRDTLLPKLMKGEIKV